VTRDSLRQIAGEAGYTVKEEPYSFEQWMEDAKSGRLKEAFACGTAAVITPIGEVRSERGNFVIGNGDGGEVARSLREGLVGIQLGQKPDTHGWMTKLA
jgi:branched-chain amino acid aminotransferase